MKTPDDIDSVLEDMFMVGVEHENRTIPEIDRLQAQYKRRIQSLIREARIEEIRKLADDTADMLPNETWKSWAFRVSDYLKDRLSDLKKGGE